MNNLTLMTLLGLVFSAVVTTGALAFFFRYGVRLALVEENLRQNNLPNLAARLVVLENSMLEIRNQTSKLGQLDEMHGQLKQIVKLFEGAMTRLEANAKFEAIDQRLNALTP